MSYGARAMVIDELWRYPVKSMIGERVDRVTVNPLGIVGDRTWATRDLDRGGIRGAKKIAGLMRFAASSTGDGDARLTFPDGQEVLTSDLDVNDRLSAALEHPVRLEALRPADDLEHFRRGGPDHDDVETELRAIFGREADEPLPDFSVFPAEIVEFESPPGTYYDCWPLLVMSTSALAALGEALPDSNVDVRRFRPSFVVDTGDPPGHPEFDWTGRTAAIGTARIEFLNPCPRCVMVTREIDRSVPADRAVLRHVVAELGQNLGTYARVTQPGEFSVGDPIRFE